MASTGRPNKLTAVVRITDDGTELTAADLIVQEVENGQPLEVAAALAGVSVRTVHNWLRNGARTEERLLINPDAPADRDDLAYRDFLHAYERARAVAERRCWELMGELAKGGTTKRLIRKTVNGQVVEETSMVETRVPSFQALRWTMANRYGHRDRIELKVEQGALSEDERADALADVIEQWLASQPESEVR